MGSVAGLDWLGRFSLGSAESTVTADQFYSATSTYKVDPVTGVILDGQTAQDNYLELDGQRVLTTTKATLGYTDANITKTVNDFKSKTSLLTIVKTTLPIGGTVVGVLLIAAGLFIRRDRGAAGAREADNAELVGSR